MNLFKHSKYTNEVMVYRTYDKKVFGEYRACESLTHKKWRLKDGEVQVKFRGKWMEVEELNERSTDRQRDSRAKMAIEDGRSTIGVTGVVRMIWK